MKTKDSPEKDKIIIAGGKLAYDSGKNEKDTSTPNITRKDIAALVNDTMHYFGLHKVEDEREGENSVHSSSQDKESFKSCNLIEDSADDKESSILTNPENTSDDDSLVPVNSSNSLDSVEEKDGVLVNPDKVFSKFGDEEWSLGSEFIHLDNTTNSEDGVIIDFKEETAKDLEELNHQKLQAFTEPKIPDGYDKIVDKVPGAEERKKGFPKKRTKKSV